MIILLGLDLGAARGWLDPHTHVPAVDLLDVEGGGLAHEIAELAVAVGAHVEIREQVRDMLADRPEHHPAVLAVDLRNRLFQNWNRRTRRLQRLWFRRRLRAGSDRL